MNKQLIFSFILFISLLASSSLLFSDELQIKFNNGNNMQYNTTNVELYNGALQLSPTAFFWTNTPGKITNDSLGSKFFQDSKGNLLYSAQHMGSPGYSTYRSSDYGNTWIKTFGENFIGLIEASDHNLYGTYSYSSGVVQSIDNGINWTTVLSYGEYGGGICEDTLHNIYANVKIDNFGTGFTTNFVFKSSNYGATWTNVYREGTMVGATGPFFQWLSGLNNNKVIGYKSCGAFPLVFPSGIYISSNQGVSWTINSALSNLDYSRGFLGQKIIAFISMD